MKKLTKYVLATSLAFSSLLGVTLEKPIYTHAASKVVKPPVMVVKPPVKPVFKPTTYLGVPVNADTLLEQKIAVGMLYGKQEIDLTEFKESQNFAYIEDRAYKVSIQNPLILGVRSLSYSMGSKRKLIVNYYNKNTDIVKKQKEIMAFVNKVFPTIIKKGMTPTKKDKAIYDYLESIGKYDEAKRYTEDADAHSAYGILLKKKGVCESYAEAYKLLADKAGLTSIVVTGFLDKGDHAWNKVKIDGQWVNVDPTNNATNSGVQYLVFETSDALASKVGLKEDKYYWNDDEVLKKFVNKSKNNDYYVKNHLEISTVEEYIARLVAFFNSPERVMSIRFTREISLDEENEALLEAYVQTNYEGFDNLHFYSSNGMYFTVKKK